MPSGIWLPDETYLQTGGQIWAQQQLQAMHGQLQAGQDWANQQIQNLQQQAQAQVQALRTPPAPASAAPPAPQPMPTPTPVATPAQAPAPAPVAAPPPPTPQPAPPPPTPQPAPQPIPDMAKVGDDWANQQIQNLLNPSATPTQATPAPEPAPTPTSTSTPSVATPSATGRVPAGPQPSQPGDLIDQARQAAAKYRIDPEIFSRQIQQESGFDPNARSGAGAIGIAQFMPATAQGMGIDPTNPQQSLDAAAKLDAQNLSHYQGDWSKALAAYNAGPGNVDQYGGVPPFTETQNYVNTILGGASNVAQNVVQGAQHALSDAQQSAGNLLQAGKQAAQDVVQTGQTAVNTAAQGVQAAVARTSQFALGLSSGDAMAFCGPAAALAFAQTYGRNPTVDEAKQLAQQVGWNAQQGMAGVGSEVALLKNLGIDAHATQGVDWAAVGRDASGGNPVIIDTPGHYYYIDGYNSDTGQFHVGTSGTDLKGGSEWMTSDQINTMPQSDGAARSAVFADHPLAQQDGLAQSTSAQASPTYMTTMQPLTPADNNILQPSNPAQDLLNAASRAVQSKAQDVLTAVTSVGGDVLNLGQQALSGGQDLLSQDLSQLGTGAQSVLDAIRGPGVPTDQSDANARWAAAQQAALQQTGSPVGLPSSPLDILGNISPYGIGQAGQQLTDWRNQLIAQNNPLRNVPGLGGLTTLLGQATIGDPTNLLLAGAPEAAAARDLVPAVTEAADLAATRLGPASGALGTPWSPGSLDLLAQGPSSQTALPGVLQQLDQAAQARALGVSPDLLAGNFDELGRRIPPGAIENPLTSLDLGQPYYDQYDVFQRQPSLYSERGVAMDPVTGQELVPSLGPATQTPAFLNSYAAAVEANPEAAQFVRTAGNQFEPVIAPAEQPASDVLTGLQNMVNARQPAQANAAFARALGGAALGGGAQYVNTDPNDPNRWLKVGGGALAGGLLAGPGVDLAAGAPVSQQQLEQLRTANLNPNVYQPTVRQGILPQVSDVTKQLLLSNPATHVGNLIGNTLEILRSPISLTLGGRPQDAIAGMTALGRAMPEAARNAWAALNGQQVATLGTAASQIPLSQPVYRVLGAADTFSRTLGEYQGMAERASQLLSRAGVSPNDPAAAGVLQSNVQDLVAAARAQGARSVFQPVRDVTQGTSFLDNLAHTYSQYKEGLLNSPNLGDQALGTLLDFELPFAGVPMRLLEVGAGRAPGIAQITGAGRALAAARAGDLPAMQRAIGETVLETSLQGMIAKGISDGNIVGPDNPDHPGGAIQLGGQWFNFDRMAGGFALPMQIMAGFAEAYNKAGLNYISPYAGQPTAGLPIDRGALDRAAQQTAAGLNAAMRPFANAVPGEALMQTLAAVSDGGASQLIQQQAQDAIARVSQPGFARFMENLTDPVAREIQQAGPDALWQPTAAAIPGLSALVPPKIDPTTGQPMPRTTTGLGQLVGAENPHLSALTQEANSLRMKYGYQVNPPRAYPNQVAVGNSIVPLSPSEQQAVVQLSGQRMAQLTAQLEQPQYTALPPLQRALALQGISRAADQLTVAATEQVLGPQEFRARVIQGLRLAGTPLVPQPQFGTPNMTVDQTNLLAQMQRAQLQRSMLLGALQSPQDTLTAANQQALAANAQAA